jgi:hypothetical protein
VGHGCCCLPAPFGFVWLERGPARTRKTQYDFSREKVAFLVLIVRNVIGNR